MSVRAWIATTVAVVAAGIAAATVAAILVSRALQPSGLPSLTPAVGAVPATEPVPSGFPAPPAGAVVLAREAGPYVLAVALKGATAQVSLLGQNGQGVSDADVRVDGAKAASCGRGCFRTAATAARPVVVAVRAVGARIVWRVDLPRDAPPATTLVARATATYKALRSLAWTDVFGSNARLRVTTQWQASAPDRLAYQVSHGPRAVIIGGRRWDKYSPGAPWRESAQARPVQQPQPFWATAVDARVIGHSTFAGRSVTIVSFFDPKTPGWYEIDVDPVSLRTLHMDMYAAAHFMHDTYGGFDATATVTAPRPG